MIAPTRHLTKIAAAKAGAKWLSSPCGKIVVSPARSGPASMASDRSGRGADAVRDRSAWLRLVRPGEALRELRFILLSTPARLGAISWRRQLFGGQRGRGRFQMEPRWNRRWNHQPLEIAAQSGWFQRFHVWASRHVRAPVCAITCAYTRGEKLELWNQPSFSPQISRLMVPTMVPERFHLEPRGAGGVSIGRLAGAAIILAGGNAGRVVQAAASGVLAARVGETFGDFRTAGAVDLVGRGELEQLLDLGADRAVYGLARGRVGRAMLEGGAQGLGIAVISSAARKPRRLKRPNLAGAIGAMRPGTPLCPHSRIPDPLAWSRSGVAGSGSAFRRRSGLSGEGASWRKGRQPQAPTTGRGEGLVRGQSASRAAGRGGFRSAGDRLRRAAHASGRRGGVN